MMIPEMIPNWINGEEAKALSQATFEKMDPANGQNICRVARSESKDVEVAIEAAKEAQREWSEVPPVQRGMMLHKVVVGLMENKQAMAAIVAKETGKSFKEALGETEGAIQLGLFYASEGQRLFGRTTTSGVKHKYAMTIRQPIGVAGLIIAANTPIANIAWKTFPALICGNAAVLKAAEDTPASAWYFGQIVKTAGMPDGVLNIVQGLGEEAGEPLVRHPGIDVISFTGSTSVGKRIARIASERLTKVSLELGGKNALIVCDDADLENAANWVILSAFSNAGQRCASASRIIIFDTVYDAFVRMLLEKTAALKIGPDDQDDFGPVINERQLTNMLHQIENAAGNGATVLAGGHRLDDDAHRGGYYLAPTIIEGCAADAEISMTELFGPVACLYRVKDYGEAVHLANQSPYGLTASIHTRNFSRAIEFTRKIQTGVAVVNGGTYGSEPHMPFGGVKQSGNGWREPGPEAIDIYTELKDIYIFTDPSSL